MQCVDSVLDMVREVDVIVLAVKPHQALPLLSKYSASLSQCSPKVLVSVVAGVTIGDLRKVSNVNTSSKTMSEEVHVVTLGRSLPLSSSIS